MTKKLPKLPPVMVLSCDSIDAAGDVWACIAQGEPHDLRIHFIAKSGDPSLKVGDFMLCRINPSQQDDVDFEARLIRKIPAPRDSENTQNLIGIYHATPTGGRLLPISKKTRGEWAVAEKDKNGAISGELVRATQIAPKARMGLPKARIIERLGADTAPSPSMMALHNHEIPIEFSTATLTQTREIKPINTQNRKDLRDYPFITIDPFDAKDHDDAVFVQLDSDPQNKGGFIIWVAIADVAAYLPHDTPLDAEALFRGNSCYFPDRVVPMLPERLSNDLCSLRAGEDRPVLVVAMTIDSSGEKTKHQFYRAMIRSAAALSYQQVQTAYDGAADAATTPFIDPITQLYRAYHAVAIARKKRAPLDLDLPERKITLGADGTVESIHFAQRKDAHLLIETFMIMANTCAAEELEDKKQPLLYRIHESPPKEKLDALSDVVRALGLKLAKGQRLQPAHLNRLLAQSKKTAHSELVSISVLRSMTQAYYGVDSLGHFGLNLTRYCHFTSPIRRYADVVIHRALIRACGLGDDAGDTPATEILAEIGAQISVSERRAMMAERESADRYLAAFLERDIGATFDARIAGFSRFGIFVRLIDTAADGVIPLRSLRGEYWQFDRDKNVLQGARSGCIIGLGMDARVCLQDTNANTGEIVFDLIELNGKPLPKSGSGHKKPRSGKRRKHLKTGRR